MEDVKIRVSDFLETGFTAADGEVLYQKLKEANGERIEVDFKSIHFYTGLFFNTSLLRLLMEIGPEKYEQNIKLVNMNQAGKSTYLLCLDNAKKLYKQRDKSV